MALKIMVRYNNLPVIYDVTKQEEDVYQLRLHGMEVNSGDGYLPQKMIIRKKGKIWISDLENHQELLNLLTAEIMQFGMLDEG